MNKLSITALFAAFFNLQWSPLLPVAGAPHVKSTSALGFSEFSSHDQQEIHTGNDKSNLSYNELRGIKKVQICSNQSCDEERKKREASPGNSGETYIDRGQSNEKVVEGDNKDGHTKKQDGEEKEVYKSKSREEEGSDEQEEMMVIPEETLMEVNKRPPVLCSSDPLTTVLPPRGGGVTIKAKLSSLPQPCLWRFKSSSTVNNKGQLSSTNNDTNKSKGKGLKLTCEELILVGEEESEPQGPQQDAPRKAREDDEASVEEDRDCSKGNYLIVGDGGDREEMVCGYLQDFSWKSTTGELTLRLRARGAGAGMGDFEMGGCSVKWDYLFDDDTT